MMEIVVLTGELVYEKAFRGLLYISTSMLLTSRLVRSILIYKYVIMHFRLYPIMYTLLSS